MAALRHSPNCFSSSFELPLMSPPPRGNVLVTQLPLMLLIGTEAYAEAQGCVAREELSTQSSLECEIKGAHPAYASRQKSTLTA
jgi:hypothetical protein